MNTGNTDKQEYYSSHSLRTYIARFQGKKGLLPDSTWKRWKQQLGLTGKRIYSPEEARLVMDFCKWLSQNGTVEEFQKKHGIIQEKSNEQQQWSQQQHQHQWTERKPSGEYEIYEF